MARTEKEHRFDTVTHVYGHSVWPKTALRVGFGVVWLVDAALKWAPGFRRDYMDTIMEQAQGQPGWLKPWFNFWIDLQHPHPAVFAYLVAVAETLIALAVIIGFARKLTYSAAIVFSLLIWSTAEGFGGPYTSGSEDIGTAIIYAMVFAALLAFSYYFGPSPLSVDALLERRISWWHRIAEIGPVARAGNRNGAGAGSIVVPEALAGDLASTAAGGPNGRGARHHGE